MLSTKFTQCVKSPQSLLLKYSRQNRAQQFTLECKITALRIRTQRRNPRNAKISKGTLAKNVSTAALVARNHDTHVKYFRNAKQRIQQFRIRNSTNAKKEMPGTLAKLKGCHVTTPKSQGVDFKFNVSKEQKN